MRRKATRRRKIKAGQFPRLQAVEEKTKDKSRDALATLAAERRVRRRVVFRFS
jgi:hypothetical protein